ncbi:unnamed protein product [Closterium sp. Yama58-4]|nr:unnamed protein product [Closterium sp. Yama58-4]
MPRRVCMLTRAASRTKTRVRSARASTTMRAASSVSVRRDSTRATVPTVLTHASHVSVQAGGYSCLLVTMFSHPHRLSPSPNTSTLFFTPNLSLACSPCTPAAVPPYKYSVVFPIDIDCPLVYQLYGLTEEAFLAQNPDLGVDHCVTIPANTQVTVAPPLMGAVHCVLYYSWTASDTCQSVADNFWLTLDDLLTLNPGINCTDSTAWNAPTVNQQVRERPGDAQPRDQLHVSKHHGTHSHQALSYSLSSSPLVLPLCALLTPSLQLCVAKGSGGGDVPKLPMCTLWYTVQAGDTCESIMTDFALNKTAFFSLNPGVGCDSLFASAGGSSLGWSGGGVQVRGGVQGWDAVIMGEGMGVESPCQVLTQPGGGLR